MLSFLPEVYGLNKLTFLTKELIINAAAGGVEIALLEDKKLVELHSEKLMPVLAWATCIWKSEKTDPGPECRFFCRRWF